MNRTISERGLRQPPAAKVIIRANRMRVLAIGCWLVVLSFSVHAGTGPETTLLVVNAQSPLSMRVANEYVNLRQIPETHVVRLDGVPSMGPIPVDLFRRKIWFPIRDYMRQHQLEEEIDVITYSADFPYAVDFSADLKQGGGQPNKYLGRIASLTSLTYFARRVEAGDIGYLDKNHYFRDFAGPRVTAHSSHPVSVPRLQGKDIRQLEKQAVKSLGRRDPESAVESYQAIVDSYPLNSRNWYNLARSQAAAGRQDEALESLATAVDYGWSDSVIAGREKFFKSLRSDPVFKQLLDRMAAAYGPFQLTHGFRSHYVWSNADLAFWEADDALDQYYLSTMLAYTGARGNSLAEIMAYLEAAASSDGTQPDGTLYLMENANVRSKTRQSLFSVTLAQMQQRKRKAAVLFKGDRGQDGILPAGKDDVIGVVAGFYRYNWGDSGSQLLPGAIAETLTSYGGDFDRAEQTKLSEFLRHGAAGSSGAVAEPYAFQEKFPVPLIHAWYADGCSLAEAFYQSIEIPFQLVVVGDPLARPFASLADIELRSPPPQRPWSGIELVEADVHAKPDVPLRRIEFWVDGQYRFDVPPGAALSWDTRSVEDGSHDIRLVAVEDSAVETRSSAKFAVRVFNRDHRVEVEDVLQPVSYEDSIEISGTAPGANRIEVLRGYQVLGDTQVRGSRWQLSIAASAFGAGPVSFVARANYSDGTAVRSEPISFSIGLPAGQAPAMTDKPPVEGFAATVYDSKGTRHQLLVDELDGPLRALRKQRLKTSRLELEGYFHVADAGFYQLGIKAGGKLQVAVNGRSLPVGRLSKSAGEVFLPLSLLAGWHKLEIDYEVSGRAFLKAVLAGDQVPALLRGNSLVSN